MAKKAPRQPIATWWKIGRYSPEIEPLRVVSFTSSYVTFLQKQWSLGSTDIVQERRERRDDIFPTFAEAQQEMIRRAESRIKSCTAQLQSYRTFLGQAESLKEPKP